MSEDAIHHTENKYRLLWPDPTSRDIYLYYRIKRRREDPFFMWILSYLEKGHRILEIGSGTGEFGCALAMEGHSVTMLDCNASPWGGLRSMHGMNPALPVLKAVQADFMELPFQAECFDAVIVRDALHHALELSRTFDEIHRVIRKTGMLLAREPVKGLVIPSRIALGEHADNPTHEHVYSIWKWKKGMKNAGLNPESVHFSRPFHLFFGERRNGGSGKRSFSYVPTYFMARKAA
jgi:ubiquinone/menaquinone biosynthesis C-methylase UbiE